MKTKTTYQKPTVELINIKSSNTLLTTSQTGNKNDYPSGGDDEWGD